MTINILAIAIYESSDDPQQAPKKFCSAQSNKELFAESQLIPLEEKSLPDFIDCSADVKDPNLYACQKCDSEYHSFKRIAKAPQMIMVISSRSSLNIIERKRLFERMEEAYPSEEALKSLFAKILKNFLQFTNKDLPLTEAKEKAAEVQDIVLKAVKQQLDNLDKSFEMEEKALDLEDQAKIFYKGSKKLNSGCCG